MRPHSPAAELLTLEAMEWVALATDRAHGQPTSSGARHQYLAALKATRAYRRALGTCTGPQHQGGVVKHQLARGDVSCGKKSTSGERRLCQDPRLTVGGQAGEPEVFLEQSRRLLQPSCHGARLAEQFAGHVAATDPSITSQHLAAKMDTVTLW
jgi:hypothetical protein